MEKKIINFMPRQKEAIQGNVALNRLDEKEILRQKQRTEKKKRLHKAKLEERVLDSEIKQNELEQRQREQQQELNNLEMELNSIKINIEMADNMATKDYYDTQTQIKKESNKENKKQGEKFKKASRSFSWLSAGASILGLLIGSSNEWYIQIAIASIFFLLATKVNKILEQYPKIFNEFFDLENKQSKVTFTLTTALIFFNCVLSVCTNYLFYKTLNMMFIVTVGFSFLFDLGAIVTSLLSYDFLNLRYKKAIKERYENKLKQITETRQKNVDKKSCENTNSKDFETIEKDEKNELENVNKNVATLENKSNCDDSKNNKKTNKKAGRKNTSKAKKNKLKNAINALEKGVTISPSKTGFTDDKNAYRTLIIELAEEMENIEKYTDERGNTRYRTI